MKLYTTPDQTAKLIELGLPKPKSISSIKVTGNIITTADDLIGEPSSVMGGKITANYSIGELIEILPSHITHGDRGFISYLSIAPYVQGWKVAYTHIYIMLDSELVDALYHTIVKLKEEGVV